MKKFSKLFATLGAVAMLGLGVFASCKSDDGDDDVAVSGISLTKDGSEIIEISLAKDESVEITATVVPNNATNKKISVESSDSAKVSVSPLEISSGETVTVTAADVTDADSPVTLTFTPLGGKNHAKTVLVTVTEATDQPAAATLTGVSITGSESIQYNASNVALTAVPEGVTEGVSYEWEITTSTAGATLDTNTGAVVKLSVNNTASEEVTVSVKVTATYGETTKNAIKNITVSAHGVEVKDEVTGVTVSGTGLADNAVTIAADGTIALTATATSTGNPTLTYAWEVSDADGVIASKTGESTATLTLTANNASLTAKAVSVTVRVSDGTNSKDATVSVTVGGKEGVKTTWDFSKSDATGTGASAWNGVPKPASQGSALVTRAENSYVGYLGRKLWLVDGVYAEYRSGGLGYTNSANDATHTSTDFVKAIESEAITGPFTLYVTANTANDARTFKIFVGTDKATLWADDNVKVSEKLAKKTYEVSYSGEDAVYIGIGTLPSESDKTVYTSITKIELSAAAEIPADKFKATDFAVKFADEAISFTENAATLNKSPADNGSAFAVEIAPAYATGASVTFEYTATTGSEVSVTKVADKNEATLTIADGISAENAGALKITVTDDSGTSLEKTITLNISATVSDADKVAAAKADITTALLGEDSTFDYVGTSVAAANATALINAATIRYKNEVAITYNTPSTTEPNLVVTVTLNEASGTVTYDFAEKYGVAKQIAAAVKLVKALEAYTWATDASTTANAITNADKAAITKYDVTVTAAAGTNKVTTTVQSTITNTEKKELVLSPYYTELFDDATKEGDDFIYASGVKVNVAAANSGMSRTAVTASGYNIVKQIDMGKGDANAVTVPVYGDCEIVVAHYPNGDNIRGVLASVTSGTITAVSATKIEDTVTNNSPTSTVVVANGTGDNAGKKAYATIWGSARPYSLLTFSYTGSKGTVTLTNTKGVEETGSNGGIRIYAIDVKRVSAIKFTKASQDIGQGKQFDVSTLLTNSGSETVSYALAEGTADGIRINGSTVSVANTVAVGTTATVIATAGEDKAKITVKAVEYVAVESVGFAKDSATITSLAVVVGTTVDLNDYLVVASATEEKSPTNTTVTWSVKTENDKITLDATKGEVTVAADASTTEGSVATAVFTVTSVDDNTKTADITITADKAPSVKQVVFTTGTNDVKDSDNKVLNVNTKLASYSQSGNKTPTTGSITGDGTVISAINYQACKIDSAGLNLYKQAETIVDGVTTNNTPDYVEIVVLRACTMIVTPTGNKIYVSKTKRDVTGTQYAESTEHKIPLAVGTWYINTNNNAAKVASLTFEYEISN